MSTVQNLVRSKSYLIFLLQRLRGKLHQSQIGEPRGDLVGAKDVLSLVQQSVEHPLRETAHEKVPLHRMVEVSLESLHLVSEGDQFDKYGERKADEDVAD